MILSLSTLLGLVGNALAYCALLLKIMRASRHSVAAQLGLIVIALFFALFPILDEPLVIYFRGLVGDLSVATLMLSVALIVSVLLKRDIIAPHDKKLFYLTLAMMSLLLYPFALGWGQADTYRLGYGYWPFEWLILAVGIFAVSFRAYFVAIWIGTALVSYLLNLYESHNLWDYLLDPMVPIIAISWVISSYKIKRYSKV